MFSCSGAQQGDPLGPLLFSLVLNKIVDVIRNEHDIKNIKVFLGFLDDVNVADNADTVCDVLDIIRERGPELGLNLNLSKCELFSDDLDALVDFPSEIKIRSNKQNLVMLGAPLGTQNILLNISDL